MICNLTVSLLGHGRVLQICVSVICDPSTLHSRPPFCGAGLLHKRLLLWSWSIFPHVTGQGLHRLQLPHEPSITRKIIGLIIPAHKQSLYFFDVFSKQTVPLQVSHVRGQLTFIQPPLQIESPDVQSCWEQRAPEPSPPGQQVIQSPQIPYWSLQSIKNACQRKRLVFI